jgi:hypothetical protein
MGILLTLWISTFAHAGCPTVQLGDDAPATIKLEGKEKDCSPYAVFRCSQGSLRISGDVKSLRTGSHQITVYCTRVVDSREPGTFITPTNADLDQELGEGGEASAE